MSTISPEDAAKQLVKAADESDNGTDAYLPQAIFAAVLAHPTEFAKRDNQAALKASGDTEMSLADRTSRSLVAEQYPLDSRNSILFPPEVAGKEIVIRMIASKGNNMYYVEVKP